MLGDPEVVETLNAVLTAELTAINQYFLDAKELENWGVRGLGKWFREQSIDEMKDAESLIDRILYLEGHPNLARLGGLRIGETVLEKLEMAAVLEREAISRLAAGIELALARHDHGTRDLLAEILRGEEAHLDELETQLDLLARIGLELYTSTRAGEQPS